MYKERLSGLNRDRCGVQMDRFGDMVKGSDRHRRWWPLRENGDLSTAIKPDHRGNVDKEDQCDRKMGRKDAVLVAGMMLYDGGHEIWCSLWPPLLPPAHLA